MITNVIPAKIDLFIVECDVCGGSVDLPKNQTAYLTNPPKKDYLCSSCGASYCLSEEFWPHFMMMGRKYDLVESDIEE